MTPIEESDLRQRASRLALEWNEETRGAFTGDDAASYRPLVEAAYVVADEARTTLGRWVDAGRRGGMSWSEVGEVVGTSKQAAQQRFGGTSSDEDTAHTGSISVRLGATAFNEMSILAREGEAGRELYATAALRLYFRQTDRRWRYLRTVGPLDPARRMTEHWEPVSLWFIFHYYKRPA